MMERLSADIANVGGRLLPQILATLSYTMNVFSFFLSFSSQRWWRGVALN